jgi:hypothetical protein
LFFFCCLVYCCVGCAQEALADGDAEEVEDPARPGRKLYCWKEFENSERTAIRKVLENENATGALSDAIDLDFGFERTSAKALTLQPLALADAPRGLPTAATAPTAACGPSNAAVATVASAGKAAAGAAEAIAGSAGSAAGAATAASAGAPAPATPRTPAKLEKVWGKVNDAVRVGHGVIFKAKLAARSLGKSRLALASAAPLNQLVGEAEAACARFEQLSMQNSDGTLAAQVDTAAILADVKAFHALLQELQKGEKSALVLRGGR